MLNKVDIIPEGIFYNSAKTIETIQKTSEINSRVTSNQTKGQFLASGVVFPHEDIILRSLKIVKENPSVAKLKEDFRIIEVKHEEFTEGIEITFNHHLKILQPSQITMAAIADTYKNKYNIDIYIITSKITDSLFNLVQQLDNSSKIGVILKDYEGHFIPVIFSKCDDKLSIVALDGIRIKPSIYDLIEDIYVKSIQKHGGNKCRLLYAGGNRQKDGYSCINDAFIILKDALRKPNLINELFANSEIKHDCNDKTNIDYQVNIAEFPKSLYKSVQNKQFLDELSPEELQMPLKEVTSTSTKLATKTLKTHLDKYNCSIIAHKLSIIYGPKNIITRCDKKWVVNFYLQIKGYRMLVKAFKAIDDGSGKVNQERADALMKKYVNPSF
jgi:hypothetical protein